MQERQLPTVHNLLQRAAIAADKKEIFDALEFLEQASDELTEARREMATAAADGKLTRADLRRFTDILGV